MSEEVRNPPRHILEYSELLRDHARLGEFAPAQREGITRMNAHAAELLSIVVGRMHAVLAGAEQGAVEPDLRICYGFARISSVPAGRPMPRDDKRRGTSGLRWSEDTDIVTVCGGGRVVAR